MSKYLFPKLESANFNPLTAGAAYIRVFIFYQHINMIKYNILDMLKIKCARFEKS